MSESPQGSNTLEPGDVIVAVCPYPGLCISDHRYVVLASDAAGNYIIGGHNNVAFVPHEGTVRVENGRMKGPDDYSLSVAAIEKGAGLDTLAQYETYAAYITEPPDALSGKRFRELSSLLRPQLDMLRALLGAATYTSDGMAHACRIAGLEVNDIQLRILTEVVAQQVSAVRRAVGVETGLRVMEVPVGGMFAGLLAGIFDAYSAGRQPESTPDGASVDQTKAPGGTNGDGPTGKSAEIQEEAPPAS